MPEPGDLTSPLTPLTITRAAGNGIAQSEGNRPVASWPPSRKPSAVSAYSMARRTAGPAVLRQAAALVQQLPLL